MTQIIWRANVQGLKGMEIYTVGGGGVTVWRREGGGVDVRVGGSCSDTSEI